MNSIWYGLAMVAIFVLVHWFVTNDSLPDGETKGIFAMKLPRAVRPKGRPKFSLRDTE